MSELTTLVDRLANASAVRDKVSIRRAYEPTALGTIVPGVRLGDDCAALPDGDRGYLLFAAEGMLPSFVDSDPWFAGYSAVMVNLSDVAAMGGRPLAIVDVVWTPDYENAAALWDGMCAASSSYGVPIVGGHTTLTRSEQPMHLAAAVIGRASSLLSSFDAEAGHDLLMAIDLRGSFRQGKPFWNASTARGVRELRRGLELLADLAEAGHCRAAKDISNGGIPGTLVMLLECSGVGATVDIDSIPSPPGVDLFEWMLTFPSYGFLLSVARGQRRDVEERFRAHGIECKKIGEIEAEQRLQLAHGAERVTLWRSPESMERQLSQ